MDEVAKVQVLEELTKETKLEDCEHSDLWKFAKMANLADPSEHPVKKEELIRRIRSYFAEPDTPKELDEEELPEALTYMGHTNPVLLPGLGRFARGQTYLRDSFPREKWERLCAKACFHEVFIEEINEE